MYLVERAEKQNMSDGSAFRQVAGFCQIPLTLIEQSDTVEIWGTSFKDTGEDFCEYRFFKDGKQFDSRKVGGY